MVSGNGEALNVQMYFGGGKKKGMSMRRLWLKATFASKSIGIHVELSIQGKCSILVIVVLMTGNMGKLQIKAERVAFKLDLVDKIPLCTEGAVGGSISAR